MRPVCIFVINSFVQNINIVPHKIIFKNRVRLQSKIQFKKAFGNWWWSFNAYCLGTLLWYIILQKVYNDL